MDDQSHESGDGIADYISEMTAELTRMAARGGYAGLAYVLEMAWLESEQLCGRSLGIAPAASPRRDGLYKAS